MSKRFGAKPGQRTWGPDFTATRDDKNVWTATWTFHCLEADLGTLIPKNGEPCIKPGFNLMLVNGCTVKDLHAGLLNVEVHFIADLNATADYPDLGLIQTNLDIRTSEEPITTHPRYKLGEEGSLTKAEKTLAEDIIAGKMQQEFPEGGEGNHYLFFHVNYPPGDESYDTYKGEFTTDRGKELCDFILQGTLRYLRAAQIWTETYNSNRKPSKDDLEDVGYIDTEPKHAPTFSNGRNWLFLGMTCDHKTNSLYTITRQWELSGEGGWENVLYNKNP